jgi:septum formation protein
MTAADIQDYVASQEPMGKAGAYAIQGRASAFISHVSGSYSGIMGLPLYETTQLLKQIGIV